MKKRLVSMILVRCCLFSLVGCGGETSEPVESDTPPVSSSVQADETDSNRYIPDAAGSTRLIKITPNNIDDDLFTVKTEDTAGTDAYETGNLKQ